MSTELELRLTGSPLALARILSAVRSRGAEVVTCHYQRLTADAYLALGIADPLPRNTIPRLQQLPDVLEIAARPNTEAPLPPIPSGRIEVDRVRCSTRAWSSDLTTWTDATVALRAPSGRSALGAGEGPGPVEAIAEAFVCAALSLHPKGWTPPRMRRAQVSIASPSAGARQATEVKIEAWIPGQGPHWFTGRATELTGAAASALRDAFGHSTPTGSATLAAP